MAHVCIQPNVILLIFQMKSLSDFPVSFFSAWMMYYVLNLGITTSELGP